MSLEGHAKVSEQLQQISHALADLLDDIAGEHVMFSLLLWGEGEDGRGQYVSNASRDTVQQALEELLAYWKERGGKDDGPYHIYRKAN